MWLVEQQQKRKKLFLFESRSCRSLKTGHVTVVSFLLFFLLYSKEEERKALEEEKKKSDLSAFSRTKNRLCRWTVFFFFFTCVRSCEHSMLLLFFFLNLLLKRSAAMLDCFFFLSILRSRFAYNYYSSTPTPARTFNVLSFNALPASFFYHRYYRPVVIQFTYCSISLFFVFISQRETKRKKKEKKKNDAINLPLQNKNSNKHTHTHTTKKKTFSHIYWRFSQYTLLLPDFRACKFWSPINSCIYTTSCFGVPSTSPSTQKKTVILA